MKKLGVFIALFTCLTIGGVYATWSYAGTNDIADSFAEAKVTIADAELTGANGVYKIETNLVLSVDQKNDDHEAELVFAGNDGGTPYLKVTFTPAANAPQNIKDGAIPSELYFDTTVPMVYRVDDNGNFDVEADAVDIFSFTNKGNGVFEENVVWEEQADGSFTYTLDEDDLKAAITLSRTFILDTKNEHDIFGGHVEVEPGVKEGLVGNILIRVTDGNVNS